jgi:hypothetical protein
VYRLIQYGGKCRCPRRRNEVSYGKRLCRQTLFKVFKKVVSFAQKPGRVMDVHLEFAGFFLKQPSDHGRGTQGLVSTPGFEYFFNARIL